MVCWSVMWYLVTMFIFTVCGAHGCVMTGPDQQVNVGTDVYLSCHLWQCPGPLDVMSLSVEWEFQDTSSQPQIILYYIKNRTVPTHPGVFFGGNVELWSFDIGLPSVTHENNGTYLCRLRLNGTFYKNQTHLIVRSAMTRRNSPDVIHLPWLLPLVSVTGLVLLIGIMFWGRKVCRSIQKRDNSKQKVEEVKSSTDTEGMETPKVRLSSMPVLLDVGSPSSSPDNIYVTMHAFPFKPDTSVTAGHSRHLCSDWQPANEEPIYMHCHKILVQNS